MSPLPQDLLKRIARSLQDEEVDVYSLSLYCMNVDDLEYFSARDRDRVRKIFQTLIEDTKHHADLLKLIVEMGSH